jgi:predicted nucleotidyltransferase
MKMPIAPTIEEVKEALLALGDELQEAEAVGVFGSLVRGDFSPTSDIDIFVVVKEDRDEGGCLEVDDLWWRRIRDALRKFQRDVTVLVYSTEGLRKVSTWYVLRLASDGILVFDQGGIRELFDKILEVAKKAGLRQVKRGEYWVWSAPDLELGEVLEVEVE